MGVEPKCSAITRFRPLSIYGKVFTTLLFYTSPRLNKVFSVMYMLVIYECTAICSFLIFGFKVNAQYAYVILEHVQMWVNIKLSSELNLLLLSLDAWDKDFYRHTKSHVKLSMYTKYFSKIWFSIFMVVSIVIGLYQFSTGFNYDSWFWCLFFPYRLPQLHFASLLVMMLCSELSDKFKAVNTVWLERVECAHAHELESIRHLHLGLLNLMGRISTVVGPSLLLVVLRNVLDVLWDFANVLYGVQKVTFIACNILFSSFAVVTMVFASVSSSRLVTEVEQVKSATLGINFSRISADCQHQVNQLLLQIHLQCKPVSCCGVAQMTSSSAAAFATAIATYLIAIIQLEPLIKNGLEEFN